MVMKKRIRLHSSNQRYGMVVRVSSLTDYFFNETCDAFLTLNTCPQRASAQWESHHKQASSSHIPFSWLSTQVSYALNTLPPSLISHLPLGQSTRTSTVLILCTIPLYFTFSNYLSHTLPALKNQHPPFILRCQFLNNLMWAVWTVWCQTCKHLRDFARMVSLQSLMARSLEVNPP